MFAGAVTLFGETAERKNLFARCDEDPPAAWITTRSARSRTSFSSTARWRLPTAIHARVLLLQPERLLQRAQRAGQRRFAGRGAGRTLHLRERKGRARHPQRQAEISQVLRRKGAERRPSGRCRRQRCGLQICHRMQTFWACARKKGIHLFYSAPSPAAETAPTSWTRENSELFKNFTGEDKRMLFSVYREDNVPVNLHAILFKDGVLFAPGSIQIMRRTTKRRTIRAA